MKKIEYLFHGLFNFFPNNYLISFPITTYMDMKRHSNWHMCLLIDVFFMSMLYNKIKIEIYINNDDILETI
jgi:hypothetical protein